MKKYKAIGWVVEWKVDRTDDWFAHPLDIRQTKQQAIDLWRGRGDKLFRVRRMHKGLSRCVRVYVEVNQ